MFERLRQLPNPVEATALLKEVNGLADRLMKIPPDRIKQITNLLEDVIELQKLNPGQEPLKTAVELIVQINSCEAGKLIEIRQIVKEAGKLPLKEIIGPPV